ncbi:hypothetical protein evm_012676 [Chilo suppressalis]|nr:hypothetical protein evm_012676 [Chilo suppressalis]
MPVAAFCGCGLWPVCGDTKSIGNSVSILVTQFVVTSGYRQISYNFDNNNAVLSIGTGIKISPRKFDEKITWLTPPRGVVPCVVADEGRVQRRPPPPLNADDQPRSRGPRSFGGENSAEVVRKRNGTEGVYQCSVQRRSGVVLGYSVHWKFAFIDKQFTLHPENSTARAGSPHVLTCDIASGPIAAVSWLRNGQTLPRNERYVFLDTQLVFTDVRKEDAGVYKCVATNTYLNKTRSSRSGWLEVLDPQDTEPAILPLEDQVNITAPRFARVQLLCPVLGWPRPKITWEFTSPGSRTAILESTDEVLVLISLEFDLEGVYRCIVDGHSHLSKVFSVLVTEPISIILPPVSKEVIRASTVRFNCSASGRPAPTITWYKDGRLLQLGGRFNMRSSTSGNRYQLVVGGVTSADAGVYQCFASNAVSTVSSWAALAVTGARAAAPPRARCWPMGGAVLLRWEEPRATVMAYMVHTTLPVPVRILKQSEESIMVSWKEFVEKTPGVAQWILQYRPVNSTNEHNITLPGRAYNYTLHVTAEEPIEIRLLGSMSEDWLPMNLTFLPWIPTKGQDDAGKASAIPVDVRVSQIKQREFTVRWHYEGPETTFIVCVKKFDGASKCIESVNTTMTVDELEPDTKYLVDVAAKTAGSKPGPSSTSIAVTTPIDGPDFFKDLTWKLLNATTVRVSWNAPPAKYTVLYSSKLDVPVELWDSVATDENTALIHSIDTTKDTYVMVTGYDPLVYSTVKTISAQTPESEVVWWWTPNGVGMRCLEMPFFLH